MLSIKQMSEVSELLYNNGIRIDVSIRPNVIKVQPRHLETAKSLLKDYAVEIVENKGAIGITPRVEKEETKEVTIGFRDLIDILTW